MSVEDFAYWLISVPLSFMKIPITVAGFTFSFWDLFIFCGLVAVFGVLVSILRK